jgi:hypothetical protein
MTSVRLLDICNAQSEFLLMESSAASGSKQESVNWQLECSVLTVVSQKEVVQEPVLNARKRCDYRALRRLRSCRSITLPEAYHAHRFMKIGPPIETCYLAAFVLAAR